MSVPSKKERVVICGTGRCGTTFLMILFTLLNLDTGYTEDSYKSSIFKNCNSGMEQKSLRNYYTKNPVFTYQMKQIITHNPGVQIKHVIIPFRNLRDSAQSRVNHGRNKGGLFHATDLVSQELSYERMLCTYLQDMVKYDIPTIFLDFDRMITDATYLYHKVSPTFPSDVHIDIPTFQRAYDVATDFAQKRQT